LLAPSEQAIPEWFGRVDSDRCRYDDLLAETQRFRGRIYLEDGAIEPYQLIDSRHLVDADDTSWHLLLLDANQRVKGCARYREHSNGTRFANLTVARSALARCRQQGDLLRQSVEAEMALSKQLNLPYVELGGWALDESVRGTPEALRMALATYALAQSLGGGVGISTVTQRHSSSSILRRLGGQSLEWDGAELTPYYDPEYKCGMEVLRFYSWAPNPRFERRVDEMRALMSTVSVISGGAPAPVWIRSRSAASMPAFVR
jgi:hypothetical protein